MKFKIFWISLIVVGLLCLYNISFGDLYKYIDDKGVVHLTNMYDSESCKTYGCTVIKKEIPLNWEYFSDNWYYNKTNIIKSSNIISVWTKEFITNDSRKKDIGRVKKYSLEKDIELQNLDNVVYFCEIDCKNRLEKVTEYIFYDDKGNVLDSYINGDRKWKRIVPDTNGEKLYKRLCVTKKKPVKKK